MANRKDNKGRVLKTGESQRPNGTYCYRYIDAYGKRQAVYAKTLKELRAKELEVINNKADGIAVKGSAPTVLQQFKHYIEVKGYKKSTLAARESQLVYLTKFDFSKIPIDKVTQSQCRKFIIDFNSIYANQTTTNLIASLKASFDLAISDKMIRSNPFGFKYSELINQHPVKKRQGLTDEEFDSFVEFLRVRNDWLLPHTIIMRDTGIRLGELIGLTVDDVDFENHLLNIDKQLIYDDKRFYVSTPKTKSSINKIPLTKEAEEALQTLIVTAPYTLAIDDVGGFFVLGKRRLNIAQPVSIERHYRWLTKEYNDTYPEHQIKVSPHILRHSTPAHFFKLGMTVPFVQRMMRHSKADMTMEVYTHLSTTDLVEELRGLN